MVMLLRKRSENAVVRLYQNNVLHFRIFKKGKGPTQTLPGWALQNYVSDWIICFVSAHLLAAQGNQPTPTTTVATVCSTSVRPFFHTWAECSPILLLVAVVLTGKLCKHATIIYTASSPPTRSDGCVTPLGKLALESDTRNWNLEKTEKITFFRDVDLLYLKIHYENWTKKKQIWRFLSQKLSHPPSQQVSSSGKTSVRPRTTTFRS